MYRDQENHTFDQDVSHALVPYEPPVSDKSHGQKRHPFLLRGAALALCFCLLGAGAGAGAVWSMSGGGPLAGLQGAAVTPVVLNSTTSGKIMSDAEIYAAAVNSVVSITIKLWPGHLFPATALKFPSESKVLSLLMQKKVRRDFAAFSCGSNYFFSSDLLNTLFDSGLGPVRLFCVNRAADCPPAEFLALLRWTYRSAQQAGCNRR